MSTAFQRLALLIATAGCVTGCSAPAPRYYSLVDALAPPAIAAAPTLSIELAPIAMPDRLARPQLVIRSGSTVLSPEVEILEQHRWSSSFDNELRDALASGVASRLGAVDATRAGRPRGMPGVRIAVQVRQFDAIDGSRVEAAFSWSIRRDDETPSRACQLALSEAAGPGVEALARGAQRVTSRLSDAIAQSVTSISGCGILQR